MIDILDFKFWDKQWSRAKRQSSLKINKRNSRKWKAFWDSISEIYDEIERSSEAIVKEALKVIKDEKLISKHSRVLEIGCGSGAFTIPLSREVEIVYALDSSEGMLSKLKDKVEDMGISNIKIINQRWEDTVFSEKFELVFAAFCPAINNRESLVKMKDFSNQYALLITFSKLDALFTLRDELWKLLTKRDFISKGYHIIFPFNTLYSLGYRPELKKIKIYQTVQRTVESLIKQYLTYFEIFFSMDKIKRKLIKEFFEQRAINGKLIFNLEREIYIMWW